MTPIPIIDPVDAGSAQVPPPPARPPGVPEKFWDAATGQIRVEALLASYLELERKLGSAAASAAPAADAPVDPAEPAELAAAVPVAQPADPSAEPGATAPPGADPRVDAFLRGEGFTDHQIRIVYALGEACLEPMLHQARAELAARHDLARLDMHFGGSESRAKACARLKAWGRTNLPPDLYGAMAGSYEGVLAMERLAGLSDGQGEPKPLRGGRGGGPLSEGQLKALMRDPKYWRDGDADLINRVRDGFRQLYPG